MRRVYRRLAVATVLSVLIGSVWNSYAEKVKLVYQYNWYGSSTIEDAYLELIELFKTDNPDVDLGCCEGSGAPVRTDSSRPSPEVHRRTWCSLNAPSC